MPFRVLRRKNITGDNVLCKNWYLFVQEKKGSWYLLGDLKEAKFLRSTPSFLYVCPRPLEVHVAVFTQFAKLKRQISTYFIVSDCHAIHVCSIVRTGTTKQSQVVTQLTL